MYPIHIKDGMDGDDDHGGDDRGDDGDEGSGDNRGHDDDGDEGGDADSRTTAPKVLVLQILAPQTMVGAQIRAPYLLNQILDNDSRYS